MYDIFPGLNELHSLAVGLIFYGGIAAVFYSFSTITTSILQGCNYFKIPVYNALFSLGFHIIVIILLIKYTPLGIYCLLIGDIIFPLLILILNTVFITKRIDIHLDIKNNIFKPLFCSVCMGLVLVILSILMNNVSIPSLTLLTLKAIIGIVTYVIFLQISKTFNILTLVRK